MATENTTAAARGVSLSRTLDAVGELDSTPSGKSRLEKFVRFMEAIAGLPAEKRAAIFDLVDEFMPARSV